MTQNVASIISTSGERPDSSAGCGLVLRRNGRTVPLGPRKRKCLRNWNAGLGVTKQLSCLPHEPQIRGIYYRGATPKPGDGSYLSQLLDRFNPETDR